MTAPRRVPALLVALVMAALAVLSAVAAAPSFAGHGGVHSHGYDNERHSATPKHVAAFTYDAPALLSQSAAPSYVPGPPSGAVIVSRGKLTLVRDRGVAANTTAKVGWNVGDDIYNVTKAGNSPAWSTVRSRFWKNEAANPQYGSWSDEQLARMRTPQRYNPDKGGIESMDLSHEPIPFRDGGTSVMPRWPQDHAAIDPFGRPGY